MKQKWYHYTLWEDFKSGMYNEIKEGRQERVKKAVFLLSTPDLLFEYMSRIATEWKYACEQTFTNPSINYQAFLGQTACNLYGDVKEDETREAWGLLTPEQRYKANKVADKVYNAWVRRYERENEENYQMTFEDFRKETKQ